MYIKGRLQHHEQDYALPTVEKIILYEACGDLDGMKRLAVELSPLLVLQISIFCRQYTWWSSVSEHDVGPAGIC